MKPTLPTPLEQKVTKARGEKLPCRHSYDNYNHRCTYCGIQSPRLPNQEPTKPKGEKICPKCGCEFVADEIKFGCGMCGWEPMTPNQEPVERELYNILADFVLVVDDCHKRGVEPSCKKEIDLLMKLISHQKALSRAEVLGEVEKTIRSFIAVNQQNRAYNEKQEPYTDRIELLDKLIKSLEEKKV